MDKLIKYFTSPRRSTRDLSINVFITIVLAVVFTLINPNYIGNYNLISMGQNLAPYAILSLGVLIPVSMGGIDLSVGATCIASAVVAGKLYELGMPLWCTIPVMIVIGALVGTVNGLFISKYSIQPFIVTLGSMMFVRGSSAIFAAEPTVLYPADCWYNHVFSNYKSIPMGFLWVAVFALAIYFLYRKTELGRYFISIGSNEKATKISGVDVNKYKAIGYMISGTMAGIAGIFWSASFATVTVATGNGMELDAVAGVYIGGTSALGGMANVFGSVIGSIMLVVVRSGLNFALARLNTNINSTYVTYVISGIIVVAAVLIERMRSEEYSKTKVNISEKKTVILKLASIALSVIMVVFLILVSNSTINLSGVKDDDDKKTVCILMKSEGAEFWNSVIEGANAAGNDYGYRVVCRGPEGEDPSYLPKQIEIAESLLAEDPVGIGLSAIAAGFTDYTKKLYDNKITAIRYDSGLFPSDLEAIKSSGCDPLVSYVKSDNYANGALAAEKTYEYVKDEIIESDEYVVGIIQHENSEMSSYRSEGFRDKMLELAESDPETAGKVSVIIEVKPSANDNAYKAALEYLFEKNAKVIFGTGQFVLNQCVDAIQASGGKYAGMKFVGYDMAKKMVDWMKMDIGAELIGVVDQNPKLLGYLSVETIIKAYQGEAVDEEVTVAGIWYNRDNVDEW